MKMMDNAEMGKYREQGAADQGVGGCIRRLRWREL